jgi:hypothetical protein
MLGGLLLALNFDPTLQQTDDPIILLQLFAHCYRWGVISPNKTPVRGRTVGDALHAIGQTLSYMGLPDPRLLPSGKLNFRIACQLSSYTKSNPPPSRVKPIPLNILLHTYQLLRLARHPRSNTMPDMLTIGFFYLLWPGEYALTTNLDSTPFHLQDIHLHCHTSRILHMTCPLVELHSATFACLEFTNQKNGM